MAAGYVSVDWKHVLSSRGNGRSREATHCYMDSAQRGQANKFRRRQYAARNPALQCRPSRSQNVSCEPKAEAAVSRKQTLKAAYGFMPQTVPGPDDG